jgi:hypothetical protein
MEIENDSEKQASKQQADKANAAAALDDAFWEHLECCGSAASVKALADALYAIGDGSEADSITRIVKELWELADQMSE